MLPVVFFVEPSKCVDVRAQPLSSMVSRDLHVWILHVWKLPYMYGYHLTCSGYHVACSGYHVACSGYHVTYSGYHRTSSGY